MILGCLDLFVRCTDLYLGFQTYILSVWTYILGFWIHIFVVGLIFCVLNLYFGVWTCILGVWTYTLGVRVGSGRVGSGPAAGLAGSGGRVGWVQHLGENPFLESVSEKKKNKYWLYYCILNLGYFYKKDARRKMLHFGVLHAPRSLIWDRFRAEN